MGNLQSPILNKATNVNTEFGTALQARLTHVRDYLVDHDESRYRVVSCAGSISTSNNFGISWDRNESKSWTSCAASTSGKLAAVASQIIHTSNDGGNTWSSGINIGTSQKLTMSRDARFLAIGTRLSSDFGSTWSTISNHTATQTCVSINGSYLLSMHNTGSLYVSSDFGSTWITRNVGRSWQGVCINKTGEHMAASVGDPGSIYISSDFGSTWTGRGANVSWREIGMDSTGSVLMAVKGYNGISFGEIYYSHNYGSTWTIPTDWRQNNAYAYTLNTASVASDGKYMAIGGGTDSAAIFKVVANSSDYGVTWKYTGIQGNVTSIGMQ